MVDFISTMIDLVTKYQSLLWMGIYRTLILGIVGTVVGLIIGLIVGALRVICVKHEPSESSIVRVIKWIVNAIMNIYITIFRGTPMMVQAMIIYFGVFDMGLQWDPFVAGLVVISINTGAYMAEIIRGGIQSVDKGQMEAARSIGMTRAQAMKLIVIPQALKIVLPSFGNEFVSLIKETSVLSDVGVVEILRKGALWNAATFNTFEAYIGVALVYMLLTIPSSKLVKHLEKKMANSNAE